MPKIRIKRFYYRNGRVQSETREVAGKFHGFNRTWHHNGQLAEALCYRHGLLHGTSRQWDEKGRLLGSFTMKHGTGRQLYRHQNGNPKLEITFFNGSFPGGLRFWLGVGTRGEKFFYTNNLNFPRAWFLKPAREL